MPSSPLSPEPQFPERGTPTYESKVTQNVQRRGPLRFEEGLATDTDVPDDFTVGVLQGYRTPPGQPNHNQNVYEKYPDETMRERAHVGSAAWVEAPTYLGEFAHGVNNDNSARKYEEVDRSGGRYERLNPANVPD